MERTALFRVMPSHRCLTHFSGGMSYESWLQSRYCLTERLSGIVLTSKFFPYLPKMAICYLVCPSATHTLLFCYTDLSIHWNCMRVTFSFRPNGPFLQQGSSEVCCFVIAVLKLKIRTNVLLIL